RLDQRLSRLQLGGDNHHFKLFIGDVASSHLSLPPLPSHGFICFIISKILYKLNYCEIFYIYLSDLGEKRAETRSVYFSSRSARSYASSGLPPPCHMEATASAMGSGSESLYITFRPRRIPRI